MDANKKKKHRHILFLFLKRLLAIRAAAQNTGKSKTKIYDLQQKDPNDVHLHKTTQRNALGNSPLNYQITTQTQIQTQTRGCVTRRVQEPNNSASLSGIREEGPTCRATRAPRNLSLYTQNSKPKRQKLPNPPSDSVGFPSLTYRRSRVKLK